MVVTRDNLEQSLARVRTLVTDGRAGIHGPDSMAWIIHRESVVLLGGGAALLMQLAHPYVAHAVAQHSAVHEDALGRFRRTFRQVHAMSFGALDQALGAARRVHAVHSRVTGVITEDVGAFRRGHRYHANDARALLWVHATLVHTAVRVVDRIVRPIGAAERARYYDDTRRSACLYGIPPEMVPRDWPAFDAYVRAMMGSDELAVGTAARALAAVILRPPSVALAPLWRWYAVMTAALLPPSLRRAYGLPLTAPRRALVRASVAALRAMVRGLPAPLRHVPAYVQAMRRVKGRRPSMIAALLERLAFGGAASSARGARMPHPGSGAQELVDPVEDDGEP